MGRLAAADIVSIWELGWNRPDWSKALIALGPALPEAKPSEIASLSVGERNAHLLALRRSLIGPVMHALVKCPICAEPLEFEQGIDELLDGYAPPAAGEHIFSWGDHQVRYRLLTSDDLAHAASLGDQPDARRYLIERAVLAASRGDEPVDPSELPDAMFDELARDMAERDPLAHVEIPLACAACEHVWSALFQIVPFLWTEFERKAKEVLEEVVTLARSYGWSEAAILEMGSARRQYYLDAIG